MQYAKAIIAGLLAGLGALGTALLDNEIAPVEWVGVASAVLTGLAVWRVPNTPPDPAVEREDLRRRIG